MTYQTETELFEHYELYTLEIARQLQQGEDFSAIAEEITFPVHLNDADTLVVEGINDEFERGMGRGMDELRELGFAHIQEVLHPVSLAALPLFVEQMIKNSVLSRAMPFVQHVKRVSAVDYEPIVTFSTPVYFDKPVMFCLSPQTQKLASSVPKLSRIIEIDRFKLKNFQKFSALSEREKCVLSELALGQSNLEIAEKLHLSRATVETHRKRIKNKLELTSFTDLMRYAISFGLVRI